MPLRKKQKTLFPDDTTGMIPAEFANLNRMRFAYKNRKTHITVLKHCRVENISYLKYVHRLDSVTFKHGGIVNADVLNELASVPSLQCLYIGEHNQCTEADLSALENLRTLKHLEFHCSNKTTDAELKHLQKMEQVTHLKIYCTDAITDEGLIALTHMKNLKNLRILYLYGKNSSNAKITGEGWQNAGYPAQLHRLSISGNLTETGIADLTQWLGKIPQLEYLCLNYARNPLPNDCFTPLEELLGVPAEFWELRGKKGYGTSANWHLIRSQRAILEVLEHAQEPVAREELIEKIRDKSWYQYHGLQKLVDRGLVIKENLNYYRLRDPWEMAPDPREEEEKDARRAMDDLIERGVLETDKVNYNGNVIRMYYFENTPPEEIPDEF